MTTRFSALPLLAIHALFTLSLHDALPISDHATPNVLAQEDPPRPRRLHARRAARGAHGLLGRSARNDRDDHERQDRKSTRLNSSHLGISYAVFCLKKKKVCNSSNRNNKPN